MRCLVFVLLMVSIECFGRTLYVGNIQIPLHKERVTIPSLHVRVDDEIVYAPLTTQSGMNTLHIEDEGIEYTVCKGEKQHVGHYWFVGNCLVGVDDNVYLEIQNDENNGYANYINTAVDWGKSSRLVFNVSYAHTEEIADTYNERQLVFFASQSAFPEQLGSNYIAYKEDVFYSLNNNEPNVINITPRITLPEFKSVPKQLFDIEYTATGMDAITFGSWWDKYWSRTMKWYDVSIYNDGEILRHFIPVPAGMVIGGYTVPKNGMWDVVKQQFYGNAGTGEFIYGVDE